jgi:hypothetical protein
MGFAHRGLNLTSSTEQDRWLDMNKVEIPSLLPATAMWFIQYFVILVVSRDIAISNYRIYGVT